MVAFALGIAQLLGTKGTQAHRILGYAWVTFMAATAVTAIFIHELRVWGKFSPIHLLIPVVLTSLWVGVRAARKGNIRRHRNIMSLLFFLALLVTGFFTLLPGRVMYRVFLGEG